MTDNNSAPNPVQYQFLRESENEEIVKEIDYDSLVSLGKKDFSMNDDEKFQEEGSGAIVFYCRDCKKIVEVKRLPPKRRQKVKFSCGVCSSKSVYYGTKRGINGYFHLK